MVALAGRIKWRSIPTAPPRRLPGFTTLGVILLSCVLLGACGGRAAPSASVPPPPAPIINVLPPPAPPPVKSVNLVLFGSSSINPGLNERPAPVLVRIYELKAVTAFDAADYFALNDKERESLGADLLSRDDYQIKPGERLQVARKLNAGTKRLAAMVAFRDLERSVWKASVAISDPPPDEIRILIDARRVQVLVQ